MEPRKGITLAASLVVMALLSLGFSPSVEAATEEDIQASIDAGIAWLVPQQDPITGSWSSSEGVAYTGFVLVKLEDRAYELGYESPFDPLYDFSDAVTAGMDYILRSAISDGNGGLYFDNGGGWHQTYNTGIGLMAISASQTPGRVFTGPGPANGMSYIDIATAVVDWFVTNQGPDGGFKYNPETNEPWDRSDNSNTGYAVLGLRYAEAFGVPIPQTLKDNLDGYIDMVQCADPLSPDFGGSGYVNSCGDWVNLLKTGNLLLELSFVGEDASGARVADAVDYIQRLWDDPSQDPGWKGGWWQPTPHYQSMYAMMKGFESLSIESIVVGTEELDWFDVMADSILATQYPDGSWPYDYWGDQILSTTWAILTLEKVAPPPQAILVNVDIKPTSCPNPIQTGKKGVTPVAILGTEEFDVAMIDPATVALEGVPAIRSSLEDVAAPFTGEMTGDCMDCTTDGADGFIDLTLKFDTVDLVAALGDVIDRECRVVTLTGNLTEENGGTAIIGEDVIRIQVGKRGKARKPIVALRNDPNPFNPSTMIHYTLSEDADVRLTVYNVVGQVVRTLIQHRQPAGAHRVLWNGRDDAGRLVSSGLYLYRMEAGSSVEMRKMILAK